MLTCHAQQHGAQWVLGPNTSAIDFRGDTVARYGIGSFMNTRLAVANICDVQGELLYYTNGIYIADRHGTQLANGGGLSPCNYTTQYSIHGLPMNQAVMFLPWPGNANLYALLHFSGDAQSDSRPARLYYSTIDREGNFGLGEVVQKNTVFHDHVTMRGGGMTATRHANGRDWWVTIAKRLSNRYYTFLLSPNGITDTLVQDIGPVYSDGTFDNSYSCFSGDGSLYATVAYSGYVTVMGFDRCTGTFSNPRKIVNTAEGFTAMGGLSVAFSPSGRYIYVSNRVELTQYDLWDADLQASRKLLYQADSTDFNQIKHLALGPNGKLYGSMFAGGNPLLHVVERPDEAGDSALFRYGGQPTLSQNSFNLPNMPNYRLGALAGSGCDTVLTGMAGVGGQPGLRLVPNPADRYLYAEMPMQGSYTMELVDLDGKVIATKNTRQVDVFATESLPEGTYYLQVTDSGKAVVGKQVVVRH